jgi:lipoprotein-anchoring transpeptidase ErfK/SrfK
LPFFFLFPFLVAQTSALEVELNRPVVSHTRLEVHRSLRRVFVFEGDTQIASYPVAIGKKGWETPIGTWRINDKIENPAWTNFLTGRVVPPGRSNPLGNRWIGYYKDARGEIGFHPTRNLGSVGQPVSHGCNRMFEADAKKLFDRVNVGDEVRVVN